MLFRYIDAFNYYGYEICKNDDKGHKRIFKIQNGKNYDLDKKDDGGVL